MFDLYCYPVKGKFSITNKFGAKGNYACGFHTGVDLVSNNKNIYSVSEGVVSRINNCGSSYGNHVVIEHADGTSALYAHLANVFVSVGQSVSCGSCIGIMGNTGKSSGTHLHFEIHNGKWSYPKVKSVNEAKTLLDPILWLEDRVSKTRGIVINVDGKEVVCESILYNNLNYIKLRDIEKLFPCSVSYTNNKVVINKNK